MTLQRGIPVLRMLDVEATRRFYVEEHGFAVDFEHRFGAGFPLYMQVSRDDLVLHLSEHTGDGTPGTVVYVPAAGVRAMFGSVEEGPTGGDSVSLTDPAGNVLRIEERG